MKSLSVDLFEKLEASGLVTKHVCKRSGVCTATITKQRAGDNNCGQRVYDRMVSAIIEMAAEREAKIAKVEQDIASADTSSGYCDSALFQSLIDAYGFQRKAVREASGITSAGFPSIYDRCQTSLLKTVADALRKMHDERKEKMIQAGLII